MEIVSALGLSGQVSTGKTGKGILKGRGGVKQGQLQKRLGEVKF